MVRMMIWRLGTAPSALLLRWYFGPDHPSKLRLWRYFLGAINNPRLSVPYGDGGVITLDYRDWLQAEILRHGSYEPEVWRTLVQYAGTDEVFWDIGSHIGVFSLLACRN